MPWSVRVCTIGQSAALLPLQTSSGLHTSVSTSQVSGLPQISCIYPSLSEVIFLYLSIDSFYRQLPAFHSADSFILHIKLFLKFLYYLMKWKILLDRLIFLLLAEEQFTQGRLFSYVPQALTHYFLSFFSFSFFFLDTPLLSVIYSNYFHGSPSPFLTNYYWIWPINLSDFIKLLQSSSQSSGALKPKGFFISSNIVGWLMKTLSNSSQEKSTNQHIPMDKAPMRVKRLQNLEPVSSYV